MRMVRMVGQAGAHAASVRVEAPGGGMMHVRCKLIWTKLNYKGDKGDMNKKTHWAMDRTWVFKGSTDPQTALPQAEVKVENPALIVWPVHGLVPAAAVICKGRMLYACCIHCCSSTL